MRRIRDSIQVDLALLSRPFRGDPVTSQRRQSTLATDEIADGIHLPQLPSHLLAVINDLSGF